MEQDYSELKSDVRMETQDKRGEEPKTQWPWRQKQLFLRNYGFKLQKYMVLQIIPLES